MLGRHAPGLLIKPWPEMFNGLNCLGKFDSKPTLLAAERSARALVSVLDIKTPAERS